jgi:erythromycin esterase
MKRTIPLIFHLPIALLFTISCPAQDTTQVVTTWLKQNSFAIESIEPANTFSDLQPLKNILNGVSVIGLGESTHGTREFFQIKHRLIRFLVREMDFTAFVIEASNTACQPINDYVLTGKGDRATVLTGQGFMTWDTEEFSALLDWMRTYNQNVPDEKKVKFYGMDVLCCHGLGREKVLGYLKKYAPEKVAGTDSLFQVLASEDEKWPTRLNQTVLQQAFLPLHSLVSYFTENKDKLVAVSSLHEWEQTFQYLNVMEGSLFASVQETPPSLLHLKQTRSSSMAKNLFYLMDKEKPAAKFMVWAYNWHISNDTAGKSTGYYVRQKLGSGYYALGFECNEGTFQTRVLQPDGYWAELKTDTILSGPSKSLTWYLSQVDKGNAFFNFRSGVTNPVIKKWFETPIRFGAGGWLFKGASQNQGTTFLRNKYDGILYIERSTPARPTINALKRSKEKIGF